jgi:hypothetical protein
MRTHNVSTARARAGSVAIVVVASVTEVVVETGLAARKGGGNKSAEEEQRGENVELHVDSENGKIWKRE